MLIGQYDGKLSEKHQVALPKKIRDTLGDRIIVTQGFEKSLLLVSEKDWKALLSGTEGRPLTDSTTRDIQRFLLGTASEIELDAKGRFVLPDYLRRFADIEENVTFLGLHTHVEMWATKHWEEYHVNLAGRIESIAEKLSRNEKENG